MLHFDQNPKATKSKPLLGRRDQMRLFSLLVALLLVIAAMFRLQQPATVAALDRVFGETPAVELDAEAPVDTAPLGIDFEELAGIKDNTVLRNQETDAWFHLLGWLKSASDEQLSTPARPISYAQLVRQPQVYRGRMVQVSGTIRRVEEVTPAENDLGIDTLYRIIIEPTGGEVWPITFYTLEAPADIKLGKLVDIPTQTAGLFFKNHSYRWQEGLAISPVVLAKQMNTTPTITVADAKASKWSSSQMLTLAGLASIAVVYFLWRTGSASPKPRPAEEPAVLDFNRLAVSEIEADTPSAKDGK